MIRLTPWQSAVATLGSRYRFMFVPQSTTTSINAGTIAEARRVLDMRPEIRVLSVTLIGRIIQADLEARASRSLVALQGEYLVAGTPAVTFRALEVYLLSAGENPSTPPAQKESIGDRMGDWVSDVLVGSGQTVGQTVGVTLAAVIKPLLLYAVIGFAMFYFATHGRPGGPK